MPNLTGQLLGKVRVDMFLARGGMADVFIGTHTTLHRAVAIKFLKGDLQDDPDLRERFEREARVIAMLRHPNIVQVYDFDTFENQPYLVMEYVAGASLGTYLRELHKNNGRLDINQINKLLGKLASALQYAHDSNVIHRDIKPANILLTSRANPISAGKPLAEDTEPIITDFGLVRFTQSAKQTSTGVITGTPVYMSPEQARGDRVDARTDVYSLGVTVYEMLAGRVPFDSDSTLSILHKQVYDPPPPIEGISTDLQDVMNRALAKNPDERFATSIEFAEAFQAAILGTTEAATLHLPSSPSTMRSDTVSNPPTQAAKKEQRRFMPVIAGIIGVMILAGVLFASRFTSQTPTVTDASATMDHAEVANVPSSTSPAPGESEAEPVGLLRFQDGTALADQVTLTTSGLPVPPEGSQYEGWLIQDDGEQIISIGVINFDQNGKGSLIYVDPQGRNLIGLYSSISITIEPKPDGNPIPTKNVALFAALPANSYAHVRHLLYSFSGTPNQVGFMDGLEMNTALLNESAAEMLTAFEQGDETGIRLRAEMMLNIILGNQNPEYKDWDGNSKVDDPSDGFGLLLNGDNEGYIQGSLSHAGFSTATQDATENMRVHGEHVTLAITNVSEWTPQLRDSLIAILTAPAGTALEGMVRQSVAFANQIRNGIDVNGNENIEAILGEGGAITAYQHAYYMADITMFPKSTSPDQATPTLDPNASPEPEPTGYGY